MKSIHSKLEHHQSQIRSEILALSQCKKGCAKCCYTDISVFEVESAVIQKWFDSLTPSERAELRQTWKTPPAPGACAFLRDETCTIYPARPIICRTQGLPLQFELEGQAFLDICPLNEGMLDQVRPNEILNLDLLNRILSSFESQDASTAKQGSEPQRERVRLEQLQKKLDNSD